MIFLGLQAKQATELKTLLQLPDPKCWHHPDVPPPTSSVPTESEYRNWFSKPSNRCKMSLQGDLAGTPLLAGLLVGSCFTIGRQQCYNRAQTWGKPVTTHSPALKAKTIGNHIRSASLPMFKHSCLGCGGVFIILKTFPLCFLYLTIIPIQCE